MEKTEQLNSGDYRSGFVAVIGRPNTGKSTFVNRAVGEKVAIVSPRPQTTRDRIRGIVSRPNGQMILVDTPGIHKPRGRKELNRRMVQAAMATLHEVDCVLHLVDAKRASQARELVSALDREIERGIRASGRPAVLLLNKVDLVAKPLLLPMIEQFSAGPDAPTDSPDGDRQPSTYTAVMPICSHDQADVERVLDVLRRHLPAGPSLYPEDQISDRTLRFMAAELVREQVFHQTRQELPYGTAVEIEDFQMSDDDADAAEGPAGPVVIRAQILVERNNHKGMVIGRSGSMLGSIGKEARLQLEALLGRRVFLELHVKVDPQWSHRPTSLDRLGYEAIEGATPSGPSAHARKKRPPETS